VKQGASGGASANEPGVAAVGNGQEQDNSARRRSCC